MLACLMAKHFKAQIARSDGKLDKTCYKTQTAEDIERICSAFEPCLVWYVWFLCGEDLVLQEQEESVLDTTTTVPNFRMIYASPEEAKKASDSI